MSNIPTGELKIILDKHRDWLNNQGGERANLRSADLRSADLRYANLRSADLRYVDLSYANLSSANLRSADLRYANLSSADLRSADLRYANLSSADLRYADLSSADLRYAKGINKYRINPYYILLDQPENIRAYKLVMANNEGPYRGGVRYEIGQTYEVLTANTDESIECSVGINVATLDWCLREYRPGYKILLVEFTAKDIAAIPVTSDGKIRLFRCKVVKELDLNKYGVVINDARNNG